jgi:GNAT superfamily N-acetyltransferase
MYSFKIIAVKDFLNLSKNEIKEIMTFINKENKDYNSPKINIKDFVNKFKDRKDEYSYFFIFKDNIIVGGFRFYKILIKDKILLGRFIYKNGLYYCIQSVYVLSNYRRKGICTLLLSNFFKIIDSNLQHKNSFETILAVDKENISAFKCYKKNGFNEVIERKVTNKLVGSNNYTEYFTEYLMIRK